MNMSEKPNFLIIMTGQLTPEHGVWELGTPLRSDMPTWAHVMRQAGYSTSISGRMHFVGHDRMHGFERRGGWAHYESPDPIKEAVVCYTRAEGCWADRKYNELPAAIDHENRRVTAAIPNLARVCYLNLIDQKDRVISARHICPDYSV